LVGIVTHSDDIVLLTSAVIFLPATHELLYRWLSVPHIAKLLIKQ